MAQSIRLIQDKTGRKMRTPEHSWQVQIRPFILQPICFAPVLPGETLKNGLFQARVVTERIRNPLIGWWKEYFWFYVKHRDLAGSTTFQAMMIDPGTDMSSQKTAGAQVRSYRSTNQINWQNQCMDAIVRHYFRGEGEFPGPQIGADYVAQIGNKGVFENLMLSSTLNTGDFNVDLNANATITASEMERAMIQWEFLKANNLMTMTYEDYLRTYGVKIEDPEFHRPELLRYTREWSYPANAVEPTTGTPASAVSWAISERIDKDRYFKEPGFIVGITLTRPKVYLSLQRTAAINLLDDAYAWLPAIMRDDPATSLKRLASNATDSIIQTAADAEFVVDLRDLFIYGDQFVNFDIDAVTTPVGTNYVTMPTTALEKRYPTQSDIDALFVGASPTALVKEDGIVRLSILGGLMDETPRGSRAGVVI